MALLASNVPLAEPLLEGRKVVTILGPISIKGNRGGPTAITCTGPRIPLLRIWPLVLWECHKRSGSPILRNNQSNLEIKSISTELTQTNLNLGYIPAISVQLKPDFPKSSGWRGDFLQVHSVSCQLILKNPIHLRVKRKKTPKLHFCYVIQQVSGEHNSFISLSV